MPDDFAAFMRSIGAEDPTPREHIVPACFALEWADGTRLELVTVEHHKEITDDLQARLDDAKHCQRLYATVAWIAVALLLGMGIARCL